jgi:hypothetical protein
LLRWLQRPQTEEHVGGVDLDSLSERELERLYAGLLKLAGLPDEELRLLVEHLLRGGQGAQLETSDYSPSGPARDSPFAHHTPLDLA